MDLLSEIKSYGGEKSKKRVIVGGASPSILAMPIRQLNVFKIEALKFIPIGI